MFAAAGLFGLGADAGWAIGADLVWLLLVQRPDVWPGFGYLFPPVSAVGFAALGLVALSSEHEPPIGAVPWHGDWHGIASRLCLNFNHGRCNCGLWTLGDRDAEFGPCAALVLVISALARSECHRSIRLPAPGLASVDCGIYRT